MRLDELLNKMCKPPPNYLLEELSKLNSDNIDSHDDKSRLISMIAYSSYLQTNKDIGEKLLEEIRKINAKETLDVLFLFRCIERIIYTEQRKKVDSRIYRGWMTKRRKMKKELEILLKYLYKVDCLSTPCNNKKKFTVKQAIDHVWDEYGEEIRRKMKKIKSNYGKGQFAARFNGYYLDWSKKENNYETPHGRKLKRYNKKKIEHFLFVPNVKNGTE